MDEVIIPFLTGKTWHTDIHRGRILREKKSTEAGTDERNKMG